MVTYSPWVQKMFPLGGVQGALWTSVNLGPHNISESTRARKLKLKTQLAITKYSLWL